MTIPPSKPLTVPPTVNIPTIHFCHLPKFPVFCFVSFPKYYQIHNFQKFWLLTREGKAPSRKFQQDCVKQLKSCSQCYRFLLNSHNDKIKNFHLFNDLLESLDFSVYQKEPSDSYYFQSTKEEPDLPGFIQDVIGNARSFAQARLLSIMCDNIVIVAAET